MTASIFLLVVINVLLIINFLNQKRIMSTQAEVAAKLQELTAQVNKIKNEVTQKLAELADAIANQGNASPEVVDALAGLQDAVGQVDDLNPDAVIPPADETPSEDPA